jgi:hypothetical protein
MKNHFPFQLILFFISLLISAQIFGQDQILYVAASSTDSPACGTLAMPCGTMQGALGRAQPTGVVAIRIAPGAVGNYDAPPIINRSNLIISGLNVINRPINALNSRADFGSESRLIFNNTSTVIANGVDNITIEGFEFRSSYEEDYNTVPMITFEANGNNSNIVFRRNSIIGNSVFSGGTVNNGVQPFLIKDGTGTISNIQIVENRFFGYNSTGIPVITIYTVESGAIRGNVFGSALVNVATNQFPGFNYLDRAIILGGAENFEIAQNEFQGINFSAIELTSTIDGILAANNDAVVRIDSNTFNGVNLADNINITVANENIDAGIKLRADDFAGDSVLIRFNEFVGNNRISIAIPNANNAFSTNGIKIFSNKLAEVNSIADLYVGSDADVSVGKLDANANWWGKVTTTFAPTVAPTATATTDILGGAGRDRARPVLWLTSAIDVNNGPAFIPQNKIVRSNGIDAELPLVFEAVPEKWQLDMPGTTYTSTPIVRRSFTLNPLQADVLLPNLTLNGENADATDAVMTLLKSVRISENLTFTKGYVQLGVNNLTLLPNAVTNGESEESFVVTNGNGRLIKSSIGTGGRTGDVNFPIGPTINSYNPVTINNTSTVDNFSVKVQPGITPPGNNGQPVTANAVGLTWDISEGTPGGSNATITLQWNSDPLNNNQLNGFNPFESYISHYDASESRWENLEWPAIKPALPGTVANSFVQTASNVTDFSPFTVGSSGAALPVDLISFTAELQNRGVLLTWNTASEKNNAYFAMERSTDGRTFSEIGRITGRGTSDIVNSYNYTDAAAAQTGVPIVYYRLKQVDTDGKFTYSKVAPVTLNNTLINLYPNPASERVTVTAPGTTQVQIINGQGQMVLQKAFTSSIEIDIRSLAKGVYIFRFLQGDKITTQKVSVL